MLGDMGIYPGGYQDAGRYLRDVRRYRKCCVTRVPGFNAGEASEQARVQWQLASNQWRTCDSLIRQLPTLERLIQE